MQIWLRVNIMKYEEILKEYEKFPSDLMYRLANGASLLDEDALEEVRCESHRRVNLCSMRLSWILEFRQLTKGWSRRKKRKINNRLLRYWRNVEKKLV